MTGSSWWRRAARSRRPPRAWQLTMARAALRARRRTGPARRLGLKSGPFPGLDGLSMEVAVLTALAAASAQLAGLLHLPEAWSWRRRLAWRRSREIALTGMLDRATAPQCLRRGPHHAAADPAALAGSCRKAWLGVVPAAARPGRGGPGQAQGTLGGLAAAAWRCRYTTFPAPAGRVPRSRVPSVAPGRGRPRGRLQQSSIRDPVEGYPSVFKFFWRRCRRRLPRCLRIRPGPGAGHREPGHRSGDHRVHDHRPPAAAAAQPVGGPWPGQPGAPATAGHGPAEAGRLVTRTGCGSSSTRSTSGRTPAPAWPPAGADPAAVLQRHVPAVPRPHREREAERPAEPAACSARRWGADRRPVRVRQRPGRRLPGTARADRRRGLGLGPAARRAGGPGPASRQGRPIAPGTAKPGTAKPGTAKPAGAAQAAGAARSAAAAGARPGCCPT